MMRFSSNITNSSAQSSSIDQAISSSTNDVIIQQNIAPDQLCAPNSPYLRLLDENYSQKVSDRLKELGDRLQPLGEKSALLSFRTPWANYDEYKITILPNRVPPGFDPSAFLKTWAQDMNNVPRGEGAVKFKEINEFSTSQKPLNISDVIQISITGDDGDVMVTQVSDTFFRVSTLDTGFLGAYSNGTHPVSGSREFGFVKGSLGDITFYTRGLDTPQNKLSQAIGVEKQREGWTSFMQGIGERFGLSSQEAKAAVRSFDSSVQNAPDCHKPPLALYEGNNLESVIAGLDSLFDTFQTALNQEIFANRLPILGNKLAENSTGIALNHQIPIEQTQLAASLPSAANLVQFLTGFESEILNKLHEKLDGVQVKTPALIQQALVESLGVDGLNLLQEDIQLIETSDDVKFKLNLAKKFNDLSADIDTGLGLPGLGLNINGNASVDFGYEFNLNFGINKTDGFYFDTSGLDEIKLELDVAPNLELTGNLGPFQIDITDQGTTLDANFSVDISDPGEDDNRLTLSELSSINLGNLIDTKLRGSANINLDLQTSVGGSAKLPSISSDFRLGWDLGSEDTPVQVELGQLLGNEPTIEFNNVELDLGSFFSEFATPVIQKVNDFIEPLRPLINVFTKNIDFLTNSFPRGLNARDALDVYGSGGQEDGQVDMRDLLKILDQAGLLRDFNLETAFKLIDAVEQFSELISIANAGGNGTINLGSFNLSNLGDIRDESFDLESVELQEKNIVLPDESIDSQLMSSSAKGFIDRVNNIPGGGFSFDILNQPETAFNLLLGKKDVTLFTYDLPALELEFDTEPIKIPTVPPLFILLELQDLIARVDLAFGYDSSAIETGNVFDGFFVSDTDQANGSGSNDIDEARFGGRFFAGVGGDIELAKVTGGGDVELAVLLNLDDEDGNGKLEGSELINSPLNTRGKIDAGISFTAELRLAIVRDLIQSAATGGPLLNYAYSLAKQAGWVNDAGQFVGRVVQRIDRTIEKVPVIGFLFRGFKSVVKEVTRFVEDTTKPEITLFDLQSPRVTLWEPDFGAFSSFEAPENRTGHQQSVLFALVSRDETIFGDSKDNTLDGGDGNDVLFGEAGNDTLLGGDGNDYLDGGEQNDALLGGAGDDVIWGGVGDDRLVGGAQNDELHGESGKNNLIGGAGNDALYGGEQDDQLEGGEGKDNLIGGAGDDTLDGGEQDDRLEGEAGDDILIGGAGDDTLDGGDQDDLLVGEAGNDILIGGAGDDTLDGGDQDDLLVGEAGNDILIGGAGDDTLDGGDQDDLLVGEAGDDTLFGGNGTDSLNGGDQDDVLLGEAGDDTLFGDNGADSLDGDVGNDRLEGGLGNDQLYGGLGSDFLKGNAGDDLLIGAEGDDILSDSVGKDTFVFRVGDGTDTVEGFGGVGKSSSPSQSVIREADVIKLEGQGLIARNMLLTQVNSDLEVTFESISNTKIILKNFALEDLDNLLKATGANADVGNILFDGQTTIRDSFDVFDVDLQQGQVFRRDSVTFLNASNNRVVGANASKDVINGQEGDDHINGLSGNDLLRGGAGHDSLLGSDGNDTLVGGDGDDRLTGGRGRDRFILEPGAGVDTITDFQDQRDRMGLSGIILTQLVLTQGTGINRNDTLISWNSGDSTELLAILTGVKSNLITSDDFVVI
jgi:Ca2+-binding RTX toxin-like protein